MRPNGEPRQHGKLLLLSCYCQAVMQLKRILFCFNEHSWLYNHNGKRALPSGERGLAARAEQLHPFGNILA